MKISISGSHSTGKTTLFNEIESDSYFENFHKISGVTRVVKGVVGLPINNEEESYDMTQLYISSLNLIDYITTRRYQQDIISDRCILDTVVYSEYLYRNNKLSKKVLEAVRTTFSLCFNHEDIIVLLPTKSIPLVLDGVRNGDIEFRNEIELIFLEELDKLPNKVFTLEQTAGRLQSLKNIINGERKRNK